MTKQKICKTCGLTKREREFTSRRRVCKPCYALQRAESYRTVEGRAAALCAEARRRAKKQGVKFDLDVRWIYIRLARGACEMTGLKFQFGKTKGKRVNPWAPSIDRIQPGGDYTKDNCRVVLHWINNALNEHGEATLEVIASRILKTKGYDVKSPLAPPRRRCDHTDDIFERDVVPAKAAR